MSEPIIIFNVSKKQAGNPSTNLKQIIKKYQGPFKCGLNKEQIIFEKLQQANLVIFSCPKEMFNKDEFTALQNYLENGGSLLFLLGQGGQNKNNTNLNFFLEQYGISVNNDCVVRTSFYQYFHPKQSYIPNGILNEEVTRVANGLAKESKQPQNTFLSSVIGQDDDDQIYQEQSRGGLDFVYPYGATLNVQKPSHAILGSGPLSYPSNRPLGAVYQTKNGKGKMGVIGSFEMFSDEYFEKQENSKIFDFLIKYLLSNEVQFEWSKQEENPEYNYVPQVAEMADQLKSCLQESEELPLDYKTLFNHELFQFDVDLIPEAVQLYSTLGVQQEPLTLIVPQFETPMLGLVPAVFPPNLRELPPPNLELFDLDDEFASQRVRLAQLTNKCFNQDVDYFIKESGDILGVSDKVKNKNDSKAILRFVLEELVNFKKLNQG